MMDFLRGATDNEMAIVGCLVVFLGSAALMALSGTVFGRKSARGRQVLFTRVRGQVKQSVSAQRSKERIA